jgi:hypothetical protein
MRVQLVFVPHGDTEVDWEVEVELEAVPQPGDYITLQKEEELETADFIVKHTNWHFRDAKKPSLLGVTVVCEYVVGSNPRKTHKMSGGKGAAAMDITGTY